MAGFKFDGADYLAASFEQMAQLTSEEKLSVIMPAAELLADRHREAIKQTFVQRSGDLAKSIKIEPRILDDGVSAHVSPKGKHRSSSTGKRFKKDKGGKRRSSGKYSGSNAEVAYILNYGSPRIAATHWMEYANEKAEPEIAESEQNAWNELLERKGL